MYSLLCRIFIKNYKDISDPLVRLAYGEVASSLSVALNILISALKLFASFQTFSLSLLTDAINNLTDAASSFITLAGFKISKKKSDKEHPYGHGRAEYIALFFVAFFIMLSAFYAAKKAFFSIFRPTPLNISPFFLFLLIFCLAVKLYMFFFNYKSGKRISSPLLTAYAYDSLADCFSSFSVLFLFFLNPFLPQNLPVDAILSLILSFLLFYNGYKALKDTIETLLGKGESKENVEEITKEVKKDPSILGVHDVRVHDYGVKMKIISLHAEVDSSMTLNEMHEIIDNAEKRIEKAFAACVIIHADPVDTKDEELISLKKFLKEAAQEIDKKLNIHDVRLLKKKKIITFDIANEEKEVDEKTLLKIRESLASYKPSYKVEITLDPPLYT